MKWDVFISHASEDKNLARNLAYKLEDSGLQVWFDSLQLNTGDSLRGKIDEGLAASEYGVVILSQAFFAKKWPQRELNGLLSREEEGHKVVLPVWHQMTASDIRKYSPILADKLAPNTADGISNVTQCILSAIFKEQISASGWEHEKILWPDLTSMIVVPTQPVDNLALLLGKSPITNQQYKEFVDKVGYEEPCGEIYIDGQWQGPFYPWKDTRFSDPMQPVVCVSHWDARRYCQYVNSQIRANNRAHDLAVTILPTSKLWEFSAYRSLQSSTDISSAGIDDDCIHQNSDRPRVVNSDVKSVNSFGVNDLFGNVWEWCGSKSGRETFALSTSLLLSAAEMRGGGYLDDLAEKRPALSAYQLENKENTRHSDLGFRLAAAISVSKLAENLRVKLNLMPRMPMRFWREIHEAIYDVL
jgi:hypothetical protein